MTASEPFEGASALRKPATIVRFVPRWEAEAAQPTEDDLLKEIAREFDLPHLGNNMALLVGKIRAAALLFGRIDPTTPKVREVILRRGIKADAVFMQLYEDAKRLMFEALEYEPSKRRKPRRNPKGRK